MTRRMTGRLLGLFSTLAFIAFLLTVAGILYGLVTNPADFPFTALVLLMAGLIAAGVVAEAAADSLSRPRHHGDEEEPA